MSSSLSIYNPSYKKAIDILYEIGFLNHTSRKKLTSGEKSNVTKKLKKYSTFLNDYMTHPDSYHLEKTPKGFKTLLKNNKFLVGDKKVVIKKDDGVEKIKLKPIKKTKNSPHELVIESIWNKGEGKEITSLIPRKNFIDVLKKRLDKPLKKNQYITVRIGKNNAFSSRFKDSASLFNYLSFDFESNNENSKDYLINLMSIVEVEGVEYGVTERKRQKTENSKKKLERLKRRWDSRNRF